MGKWRAAVLIGVHLVIAIHITLWLALGRTVSPVEPSESMQTLELGAINAGFVFFSLALLSTLIFGRYFCGWGCHIVALQDFCAWIMKKCGVHPRPFRSRLLLFVPLTVALYMFVWPNFKRFALFPALDAAGLGVPYWLKPVAPFTGFSNDFVVEDFWATFVPWYLAIPYFFTVGFAIIYFLGAKGFCTYGCPYGGFFAPVDKLAPGRIRVNDNCNHCGHCTAVCTSNVRVHEEVASYGMVIDPGCMKCMDCVSACPNDALFFGFGRPALGAKVLPGAEDFAREAAVKRARRWDLSWPEEIAAAILFAGFFFAFRQFFYVVPMLMAVGLAGIGTFITWKLVSLFRKPSVTIQNLQLKLKGRLKPAGLLFTTFALLFLAAAAWGGLGRWHLWQGHLAYNRLDVPLQVALRPEFVARPRTLALANTVASHYAAAQTPWTNTSPASGASSPEPRAQGLPRGYGLDLGAQLQRAYALVLLGRRDEALAILQRRIDEGRASDELVAQAVLLISAAADPADPASLSAADAAALSLQQRAVAANPNLADTRARLAQHLLARNRLDDARAVWSAPAAPGKQRDHHQSLLDLAAARFHLAIAEPGEASTLARRAAGLRPRDASIQVQAAIILTNAGDRPAAMERIDLALAAGHLTPQLRLSIAEILAAGGKPEDAEAQLDRALTRADRQPGIYLTAATLRIRWGSPDRAAELVDKAAAAAPGDVNILLQSANLLAQLGRARRSADLLAAAAAIGSGETNRVAGSAGLSPWDRVQVGRAVLSAALATGNDDLKTAGLRCFTTALDHAPDSPTLLHDAAQAHLAANDPDTALDLLTRAAALGENNAPLAQTLAQVLEALNRPEEATRWREEAARRQN